MSASGEVDITGLKPTSDTMRAIRGSEIAMIFQEPMSSLNPVYTVGSQIQEAILLHQTPDKKQSGTRQWTCCARSGCRTRSGSRTATRTSCPAACGSGP